MTYTTHRDTQVSLYINIKIAYKQGKSNITPGFIWNLVCSVEKLGMLQSKWLAHLPGVTPSKKLFDIPVSSRDVTYQTLPGRE
jgi:hypothetical protein